MLTSLHIRDLAIVTSLEVEFGPGMTVLTGETGAGKSILIDALGLVLGDRADNGMIRSGSERAEITASFDIRGVAPASEWLSGHDLDQGDECILRRVLSRSSNSRGYVNGRPVPVKLLQEVGDLLVNIHGQHAHQALLQRDHQRLLLDEYGDNGPLCAETASLFSRWHQTKNRLDDLTGASRERLERIDLLRYQTGELGQLRLGENELELVEEEHRRLSNAGRLLESSGSILSMLDDEDAGVLALLNRAGGELDDLASLDPSLQENRELMESAIIQVQETISNINHYADALEMDPARLGQLNQRLEEIHDLARKYRCRPEELNRHLATLQQELEQLEHADIHLAELEKEVKDLESSYLECAKRLGERREDAARDLGREVSEKMNSLGMGGGKIDIRLDRLPMEKASAQGLDRVEFLVSANPGHPLQPLSRVASGGELSRISLAIQVATIRCHQISTLIFDEVDVGIGGGVAEIVGRLLRQLGQNQQVLCVTHLPQVAAQGHQHLLIRKSVDQETTATSLASLEGESRTREVARMLGGLEITEQTISHAREMLNLQRQLN